MAKTPFSAKKHDINTLNSGYQYTTDDQMSIEALNNTIENSFYASQISESVANQLSNLGANDKIEFKGSNPNLLINGDFRVNQRGKPSYTSYGFTVDRWYTPNANLIVTPNSAGSITLFNNGSEAVFLYQMIEDYKMLTSKTITASCKVDNIVYSKTETLPTVLTNTTGYCFTPTSFGGLYIFNYNEGRFTFTLEISSGQSVTVQYAKLEFGSVATPNIPRPYAEELALCQRYYQVIKNVSGATNLNLALARNTTNGRIFVNLTQSLRTSPTIKNTSCVLFDCVTSLTKAIADNSITLTCLSSNQAVLNGVCEDLTAGRMYFVSDTNGLAKIELDAEIY